MRLDLKKIIHVPGAELPFSCQMDLSGLDFYGARPICEPVTVTRRCPQPRGNAGVGGNPVQQPASEL